MTEALWQKYYDYAVAQGFSEPKKHADALLRVRTQSLEIESRRHRSIFLDAPPAMTEPTLKQTLKKTVAQCCKAMNMNGKKCGFKAFSMGFCKKHSVKNI